MIHVLHVITGLERGGAESMLAKLLVGMDRNRFCNTVVSLSGRGPMTPRIEATGALVHDLGMRRGLPDPRGMWRLSRLIRASRPDLVQTWLYHADLLGLFATWLAGGPSVVWNVRCSDMDFGRYRRLTSWVVRIAAALSRMPVTVIVNSGAGLRLHESLGYRPRHWELIPNGFDTAMFHPDPGARARLRAELGVDESAVLIGHVARVDPMKDHAGFLEAAAKVAEVRPTARIVLAGKGTKSLTALAENQGIGQRMHLLGDRNSMPALMAGLDIFCLSSAFGEGFPNVLGEAMASGVACVSTEVGDAAQIIGNCGLVVPPRDPAALAGALIDLVDRGDKARGVMGSAARARITAEYALPKVVARYEAVYVELLAEHEGDARGICRG